MNQKLIKDIYIQFYSYIENNLNGIRFILIFIFFYWTFNIHIENYIINPIENKIFNIIPYSTRINSIVVLVLIASILAIKRLWYSKIENRESKILYICGILYTIIFIDVRIIKDYEYAYVNEKYLITTLDLTIIPIFIILSKGLYQSIIDILNQPNRRVHIIEETSEIELENDKLEFKNIIDIFSTIFNTNFSRTFTIGINGKWGTGKSTIINFIIKKTKKDNDINIIDFHFNPFETLSEKKIEIRFFEELSNRIGDFDKNSSTKIFYYLNTILKEEKWYHNLIKILIPKVQIENIEQTLLKSNKKLIIVIDDLDRLTDKNEILTVLKIIRNFENVKNTYFIISYWKEHLIESILETKGGPELIELEGQKKVNRNSKDNILDKFINYEYSIPEIDKHFYLKNYLSTELVRELHIIHPNLEKENIESEVNSLIELSECSIESKLIDKGHNSLVNITKKVIDEFKIYEQFENLRDLKKFLVTFLINYKTNEKSVNFFDYFIYSLWKFKNNDYKHIYNELKRNPEILFGKSFVSAILDENEITRIDSLFKNIKDINYEESKPYIYLIFCNRDDYEKLAIRNWKNYEFYFQDRNYPTQISEKEYSAILSGLRNENQYNHLQKINFIDRIYDDLINENTIGSTLDTKNHYLPFLIYVLNENRDKNIVDDKIKLIINKTITNSNDLEKIQLNENYMKGSLLLIELSTISMRIEDTEKIQVQKIYTSILKNYSNFKNFIEFINLDYIEKPQKIEWISTLLKNDPNLLYCILEFDIDKISSYNYFKIRDSENGLNKELETCIKSHYPNESKIINWDFIDKNGGFLINLYKSFTSNDIIYEERYINKWKPLTHHTLHENGKYADKKLFQKFYFISSIDEKYSLEDAKQGKKYYLTFELDIPFDNSLISYAKIEYQVDDFLTLSVNGMEVIKRDNSYYKKSEHFILNKNLIKGENSFEMTIENISEIEGSFPIHKPEDNLYGVIFNLEIKFNEKMLFGGSIEA